jgi:hypothetical protein
VWFEERVATEEVAFELDVFLLQKEPAASLKAGVPLEPEPEPGPYPVPEAGPAPETGAAPGTIPAVTGETKTLRLVGTVPPEVWNRLGTKILPKLRSGSDLKVGVVFAVTVSAASADSLASELRQIVNNSGWPTY